MVWTQGPAGHRASGLCDSIRRPEEADWVPGWRAPGWCGELPNLKAALRHLRPEALQEPWHYSAGPVSSRLTLGRALSAGPVCRFPKPALPERRLWEEGGPRHRAQGGPCAHWAEDVAAASQPAACRAPTQAPARLSCSRSRFGWPGAPCGERDASFIRQRQTRLLLVRTMHLKPRNSRNSEVLHSLPALLSTDTKPLPFDGGRCRLGWRDAVGGCSPSYQECGGHAPGSWSG